MKTPEISVAISGHAKHGKSTLAGRLLYDLGAVSESDLERRWLRAPSTIPDFDRHRKEFNRFNVIFLDKRQPTFSRASGQPDDPSRTAFPMRGSAIFGNEKITVIDQPGYSRFIGNIVYGLYQSDLMILAVDIKKGIQSGTKRVAQMASYFQIPTIAICVTKMDEVGFSEVVFRELEEQIQQEVVSPYLRCSPPVIPVYALGSHAAGTHADELSWYNGLDLLEVLRVTEGTQGPSNVDRLRFPVREVYAPPGVGTVLVGVLETGSVQIGESLILEPANSLKGGGVTIKARSLQAVRGISDPRKPGVDGLTARLIAALATNDLTREEAEDYLRHGSVLGRPTDPPTVSYGMEAELVFFRSDTVYSGREFKIRTNACDGEARINAILDRGHLPYDLSEDEYDAPVGEIIKASIELLRRPICIESDQEFKRLTRFALLDGNEVVACGRCIKGLTKDDIEATRRILSGEEQAPPSA